MAEQGKRKFASFKPRDPDETRTLGTLNEVRPSRPGSISVLPRHNPHKARLRRIAWPL